MALYQEYLERMKKRFTHGCVQAMPSQKIEGLAEVTETRLAAIEDKLATLSKVGEP